MKNYRVAVTGLGVIAPNGIGKEEFWSANTQGISVIEKISLFEDYNFNVKIAGQVKNFDPLKFMSKEVVERTDRFVHLGVASAKLAVEDSDLDLKKEDPARIGVIVGSGNGGQLYHEEHLMAACKKGFDHRNPIHPLSIPRVSPNAVASHIAIQFNLQGPNMVISTACSSGAHAIGEAFRKIQHGELDICVSGGVEAPLTPFTFGAYSALRVLSKHNAAPQEASRPFDRERDGFILSEGAGILILEELDHALRRNTHIYSEIRGYAANSGAYHMVVPVPDGTDAAKAIYNALQDASLSVNDIDYINAHGTSTQANDMAETSAIKSVFGERAYHIPISSTKSMIGHSIGAAGAIEAVVCALSIKNGLIPPTINYHHKDPDCDLDYTPNQSRRSKVGTALSNSFGFGGSNVCLVLSKENL